MTTNQNPNSISGTVELPLNDLIAGDVGSFDADVFEILVDQGDISIEDVPGGETPYLLHTSVVDFTPRTVILDVEVTLDAIPVA